MPDPPATQVTLMLRAIGAGEEQAAAKLLPVVYDELRKLARSRMNKVPPGQTLQATALVHEAYLRLVGDEDPGWNSRGHFFGAAARAMRDILVEQARRKASLKRGGDRRREGDAGDLAIAIDAPPGDLLALDELIERIEEQDPRKAQVVMLRFFAGLTNPQIAEVLGVSLPTVERDWRFTRSWLQRELAQSSESA